LRHWFVRLDIFLVIMSSLRCMCWTKTSLRTMTSNFWVLMITTLVRAIWYSNVFVSLLVFIDSLNKIIYVFNATCHHTMDIRQSFSRHHKWSEGQGRHFCSSSRHKLKNFCHFLGQLLSILAKGILKNESIFVIKEYSNT
jgi:hypothetical protein